MLLNSSLLKKIFSIPCLFLSSLVFVNCEYYKAYKYNEQGIQEFNETKLSDSRTSFHKSISYSYKSYIPTYNIGNTLMQEDDLPAAHEKFQQAIEANPEFKEALYNDGQALYLWGKKELSPNTCNIERARVLWEQAINRFKETAELANAGDYKKPSLDNANFISDEISKLEDLEENKCQNQNEKSEEEKKDKSDSDQNEDGENKESKNSQANNDDKPNKDGKDSKDKDKSGKDGKDSKDKDKSGKEGKDSKDKNESGKDGKDSKDKDKSGKDGKDSKDKDKSGKDGKDSKDKNESDKDGKDSKDKNESGKDGKDSKDKDKSGKDGKDSKDKDKSGKDGNDSKEKDKSGKDGKDSKDKSESGKDGKDSKDKDKSGSDGSDDGEENNGTGGNGYLPAKDGGYRKPTLTPDEQKRLQKEMERIQKRSGESKNHKRSRHQQEKKNKDQEELEQGLKDALW